MCESVAKNDAIEKLTTRIDDAMEWKRDIGPVLAELLEYQHNSALSITALKKELQELRSNLTGVAEVSQ